MIKYISRIDNNLILIMFICCPETLDTSGNEDQLQVREIASNHNNYEEDSILVRSLNFPQPKIKEDSRYVDPTFPLTKQSLGVEQGRLIEWVQLTKVYPNIPLFCRDKKTVDNLIFGFRGINHCLLSVLIAFAQNSALIKRAFMSCEDLNQKGYYSLLLKDSGLLRNIFIDEFIPVFKDTGKPVFGKTYCELWPLLLEKALAKVAGSYGNLQQLSPRQILSAINPGPCETIMLQNISLLQSQKMLQSLKQTIRQGHIILGTTSSQSNLSGLSFQHTYPCIRKNTNNQYISFINPSEYSLQFSPKRNSGSTQQSLLESSRRVSSSLSNVSIPDFKGNFMRVDVCYQNYNFHHYFQKLRIKEHQKYLTFRVDVHKKHQAFIAIYKMVSLAYKAKGQVKMILGKVQNQQIHVVSMKSERFFNDCFLKAQMEAGQYQLLVQCSDCDQLSIIYSQKDTRSGFEFEITRIYGDRLQFLQRCFISHCLSNGGKKSLVQEENIKLYFHSFLQAIGYCYCFIGISQDAQSKFNLTIDRQQIQTIGFKMLRWNKQWECLKAGSRIVIVFQAKEQNQIDFQFPPKGFSINQII